MTGDTHTTGVPAASIVDVTDYGVIGDGKADDTAAMQRAANEATPAGALYIPADCSARITDRVDCDLGGKDHASQFRLACDGAVVPEAGADVFVHNGRIPRLFLRAQGGSGDVDEDAALRVENVTGGLVSAYGMNYPGTLLRLQWQGHDTEVNHLSVGEVRSEFCGRAFYAGPAPDADPNSFCGGFGQVGDVWEKGSKKNFTARNLNDLCINQYENHVHLHEDGTEQGVVFDNCNALWVDRMLIGGTQATPLLEVRECHFLRFGALTSFENRGAGGDGYVFDSVRRAWVNAMPTNTDGVGIRIAERGSRPTEDVIFRVDIENGMGGAIEIGENVTGPVELSGTVRDSGDNETPAIDVRADARIVCDRLDCRNNDGVDLRSVGDDLHLLDCDLDVEGGVATDRRL